MIDNSYVYNVKVTVESRILQEVIMFLNSHDVEYNEIDIAFEQGIYRFSYYLVSDGAFYSLIKQYEVGPDLYVYEYGLGPLYIFNNYDVYISYTKKAHYVAELFFKRDVMSEHEATEKLFLNAYEDLSNTKPAFLEELRGSNLFESILYYLWDERNRFYRTIKKRFELVDCYIDDYFLDIYQLLEDNKAKAIELKHTNLDVLQNVLKKYLYDYQSLRE